MPTPSFKQRLSWFFEDLRFRIIKFWERLRGYKDKNGKPLKCYRCKSKDLDDCNYYYDEIYICEYDCKCKKCGQILGHWAYGYWEL